MGQDRRTDIEDNPDVVGEARRTDLLRHLNDYREGRRIALEQEDYVTAGLYEQEIGEIVAQLFPRNGKTNAS